MAVMRILGVTLLGITILFLGDDLVHALSVPGGVTFTSLGDVWGTASPASLNLVQAVVQRYVHPIVWDPVLVTLLLLPARGCARAPWRRALPSLATAAARCRRRDVA